MPAQYVSQIKLFSIFMSFALAMEMVRDSTSEEELIVVEPLELLAI